MMRTENDVARERLRAWIAGGHDGPTQGRRQKASEVVEKLVGDVPSIADCEYTDARLNEAHNNGYGLGVRARPDDEAVKAALQKAERAFDPMHARTCAAVELMMKKSGITENDRQVIARTCDCNVTPDDALTAVREALRGFE